MATCMGMVLKSHIALMKRLKELIEVTNVKPDKPAKPTERKRGRGLSRAPC